MTNLSTYLDRSIEKLKGINKVNLQIATNNLLISSLSDFKDTKKFKQQVVRILNTSMYWYVTNDRSIEDIKFEDFMNMDLIDIQESAKQILGSSFIEYDLVDWSEFQNGGSKSSVENKDKNDTFRSSEIHESVKSEAQSLAASNTHRNLYRKAFVSSNIDVSSLSEGKTSFDKSMISLQPPTVPVVDTRYIFMQGLVDNSNLLTIYRTLPVVPTMQREISVTTDVDDMTDADLLNLFPSEIIHTRYQRLYEQVDGIDYDEILGSVLPIKGFTLKQRKDNIVKYPHFYKIYREIDGKLVDFAKHIEIDGKLYPIKQVWSTLTETKNIPGYNDYVRDYVIRRYLLERDIKQIEHKYPMYGSLYPYVTLFADKDTYRDLGYKDAIELARQCVKSRVSYLQTRNPIIRRLKIT